MNITLNKNATNVNIFIAYLMDNVSNVMLEQRSNYDTVRANSVINLPRQALFRN
jgi:hypothetical protein